MKKAVFALFLSMAFLVTSSAWANGYLDTAALLLDESKRSVSWIERRFGDKALAEVAHMLAEARVQAGRRMTVHKNAERAHPHLLLALETIERALFAAKNGDGRRFLRLVRTAREEERTYRELLQQSKMRLPEIERAPRTRR